MLARQVISRTIGRQDQQSRGLTAARDIANIPFLKTISIKSQDHLQDCIRGS
jgi:hypothetical protein